MKPTRWPARLFRGLETAGGALTALAGRLRRPDERAEWQRAGIEQRALLRLGELAASAPLDVLLNAMAEELARITDIDTGETFTAGSGVCRFEPNGDLTLLAGWGRVVDASHPIGISLPLDGESANSRVYATGRPARMDGHVEDSGSISRRLSKIEAQSVVAVPIFVNDKLWGSATVVSDRPKPLPPTTEARLMDFASLAATAISSAERREAVRRLVDEQAALRRVAMLVATGTEPERLWTSVVAELGRLCDADRTQIIRRDSSARLSDVAVWESAESGGMAIVTWPPVRDRTIRIARQGVPADLKNWSDIEGELAAYVRESLTPGPAVVAPVLVDRELWGGLVVHSRAADNQPLEVQRRAIAFANLVTAALANATARAEVRLLVDEQATVGHVATLVAGQASLGMICQTVGTELEGVLGVQDVRIFRYDGDDRATVVASSGLLVDSYPVGSTTTLGGAIAVAQVRLSHRVTRIDGYDGVPADPARLAREAGLRTTIAYPILVGDRLWGTLTIAVREPGRIPRDAARPIEACLELITTAIRNGEAEEGLRASRERLVTAADQARRRFERDLHDGAQQRLVSLASRLRSSREMGSAELEAVAEELDGILNDLRGLARGLHPTVLSEGGLLAAMRSLTRRCPIPVRLRLPDSSPDVGEAVGVACCYVVAEALTNAAKHARATVIDVELTFDGAEVRLSVADDGVGGADLTGGSGLLGITDRVEALDGTLSMISCRGAGTTLVVHLPVTRRADEVRNATSIPTRHR